MDSLRRNIKGAYTIWYRELLRFFSDRMRIVTSLAQPLLFLLVLGSGLASAMRGFAGGVIDFRQFMFPGILGMTVLFTSIFSAVSVVWDREFGFMREVMVAPVSRLSVALGKIAGGSTVAMLQGSIVLLLSPLVGVHMTVLQIVEILGLMLLLAGVMTSFGLVIAARQKTMEGFQVIMQFLLMPMLFMSGALFPLTGPSMPRWLSTLTRLDPVTYGVDPLRQVALSETAPAKVLSALSLHSIPTDVAILCVLMVVFLIPGVLLFAKQD